MRGHDIMRLHPRLRALATWPAACCLALLSLGCSGDDDEPGPGFADNAPIYIGTTRVFSGDESLGYLFRFTSLDDDGTEIDLRRAVELDDAWVFGDAKPYFYTATIFSPTIKQWSLDEHGEFVEGPVVNFSNEDVKGTYSAAFTPIYSPEKSYFVDSGSAQLVVWSPQDVTFIKTIPIDVSLPEDHAGPADLTPTVELTAQKDNGRVLVNVFWNSSSSGWTQLGGLSRLIVIDAETDEIIEQRDEARCESLSPVGTTSSGTTYYTPWDYHVSARAVFGDGFGSKSCGLRVKPEDTSFDDGYDVDLSELVGGRPAGSAFLMDDDHLLLHVWHEELSTATPENWTDEGRWQPSYKWYRWDIGSDAAEELPDQAPSSEGSNWAKIDGRLFTYSANPEYSETTLVELKEDGTSHELRKIPGWSAAMIRAR